MRTDSSTLTMQANPSSHAMPTGLGIHAVQAGGSTHAMHFCSSAELVRALDVPGKAAVTASDMRVKEAPR